MVSHFFGRYNIHKKEEESPELSLKHHTKHGQFELFSSLPILESEDFILSIHGSLFNQNWQDRPQEFLKKFSREINENRKSFHQSLDGTFFIIAYSKRERNCFLLNNRYQTSTCYYSQEEVGNFIFSSKIDSIINGFHKRCQSLKPNLGAIQSFLSNGFTMTDEIHISGIKKLLPCQQICVSPFKTEIENFASSEYFHHRKSISNIEQELDRYEEIYRDGISHFLHETKPNELGTLLSGGHDTSFALIQASKIFSKPIHSYTVTFPDWAWDERNYAENICQKFNGIFHPISFTSDDLDLVISMVRGNQEPVVGSSLPLHKLSQIASKEVDCMLGGDGGDTLWGEYYPVGEFHRFIKDIPQPMRELIHSLIVGSRKLTDWERLWELEHVSSLFLRKNYYDDFMRRLCTYRHFSDEFLRDLLKPQFFQETLPSPSYLVPFNKENFDDALIYGKLYNAFYCYQSFSTHRSLEYFGTPLYLPTINKDLIKFIGKLPRNWLNGGTSLHRLTNNKTINRRFHKMALARYLKKEEIYNRSFDIPWYKILKPRKEVLSLLLKRLKNRGWYKEEVLDKLFAEFQIQTVKDYELLELKHHGYRVFTLLSLEVWAIEYLDGRMTPSPEDPIKLEDYLS